MTTLKSIFLAVICLSAHGVLAKNTHSKQNSSQGWAYVNYVVDASGNITNIDILDQSEFSDVSKNLSQQIEKQLRKQPASHVSNTLFIAANKSSNLHASKSFYQSYAQIEQSIATSSVAQLKTAIASQLKPLVKTDAEQALYYWLKSRAFHKHRAWADYDTAMMGVFNTAQNLPAELSVAALKSAINWFNRDQNYQMASFALNKLETILKRNAINTDELHEQYVSDIQHGIVSNKTQATQKQIANDAPFFRKVFLSEGEITVNQGKVSNAQLRCDDKVEDLSTANNTIAFSTKGLKNCHVLVKTNSAANVTLVQTGNINLI
ncbi:hypothetical protein [Pseudoalteromonas sp. T1lg24]|uniref:hypothetical protein n=1 Tax=Pseudoalteromonas sp. T1lg24 TaxID=2077099 RepID=UPI000CF71155|nr:hypothetical protein [Pseudoalteromonas sp. T1lg24]